MTFLRSNFCEALSVSQSEERAREFVVKNFKKCDGYIYAKHGKDLIRRVPCCTQSWVCQKGRKNLMKQYMKCREENDCRDV